MLIEIDDTISGRRTRRSITSTVFPAIDESHGRGAATGETGTGEQSPEPNCERRGICRREEITRGNTHGRAKGLEQARSHSLFDVATTIAGDVAD